MIPKSLKAGLLSLAVVHIILSIYYGIRMPWGGDEWYTYSMSSFMALPNTLLISLSRTVYGAVSVHNYLYYRQIGLFWGVVSLFFLFWIAFKKGGSAGRVALFQYIFIVLSSFVLFQEQYFRYYGFYLLCSLLVFYLVWMTNEQFTSSRKYLYPLLLISPFLFLFLTWQLAWYILLEEFLRRSRKTKIILVITTTIVAIPLVMVWKPLMLFSLKHIMVDFDSSLLQLRGFGISQLLKPVYAVFQFIFGYDMEPTESFLVIGLFGIIAIGFIYRLYTLRSENPRLLKIILLAGIIPFLSMFWVLEPLTLPGATQFESKHGIFFLPVFLVAYVPVRARWKKSVLSYLFLTVILISAVWGTVRNFYRSWADWGKVVEMAVDVQEKGGIVVVDGRAEKDFRFYGNGKIDGGKVLNVYEIAGKQDKIQSAPSILLVTCDWKSYQLLSVEQNWNTGTDTKDRFNAVSDVFEALRKSDKVCTGSYGLYPLFSFKYESGQNRGSVAEPKPGFFILPYRDVQLPICKDGVVVHGWEELSAGDVFAAGNTASGDLEFYYFIRCKRPVPERTVIGNIRSSKDSLDLVLGPRGNDVYSSMYCRPLKDAETYYRWHKRPVVTQSLRYPGSFWSSKGSIYRSQFWTGLDAKITVTHPDVVLNVCYVNLRKN